MRRRLFCLLPFALLAACEEQPAATVQPEGPEPERVYSPGPIAWSEMSEEHRRRARMMIARHQESVPEDEDSLRARWEAMSPAQQRFAIRAPRRMSAPRDTHPRSRTTRSSASRTATPTTTRTHTHTTRSSQPAPTRSGSSSSSRSSTPRLPTPPRTTPRNDR